VFKETRAKFHMNRGIKAMEKAKQAAGADAERLFQEACKCFASSMAGNVALPEALYNWGLALFYHGQTQSGKAARSLYKSACEKFSTAQTIEPDNPNTATDWGVALMALAKEQKAGPDDDLYQQAEAKFLAAEEKWPGIASYNLSCLYSLRGAEEACREALEAARKYDELPEPEEIEADPDLADVSRTEWFQAFVAELTEPPAAASKEEPAEEEGGEKEESRSSSSKASETEQEEKSTSR
jgi:tetratricopeptide (TPR) repeat protein